MSKQPIRTHWVFKTIYLFCLILWVQTKGFSQKQFTLLECVDMALENNLQVKGIEFTKQNAEISLTQSRHAQLPNLGFNANFSNSFGRTVDPTSNSFISQSILSNGLSMNTGVLLFNGFRIQNTIDQNKLSTIAATKDIEQLKRDISLNVASAYLNILFANENMAIAQNQLAQTMAQREVMSRMIRVGNSPENAIFDLDAQIALNEQTIVTATNNRELALLTLRQLIRLDPTIPLDITTPAVTPDAAFLELLTIDELMESAFLYQAGIEAAKLRVQMAEKGEKIAAAGYYPSLTAGFNLISNFSNRFQQLVGVENTVNNLDVIINGQTVTVGFPGQTPVFENIPYFDQLNNNLSYGIGLNLSVPIYSNYNVRAAKNRSVVATGNAKNNLEIQKDNLRVTVMQSFTEAKAARARYNASEKSFLAQTNVYENAKKRFEAGSVNSFELVRVKALQETAQNNLLIAKYDLFFRLKVLDFYLGKPIIIE
ncbi:MAG: TolC family protein [Saprospiraceae bacterium]|nr:TolC family protein [Saprospiraceae bacterium]